MKILLTGGGTGGHVMPNIALIPAFKARGVELSYMGSPNSIEERLISKAGIDFYAVTTVKCRRDNILKNVKIPYLLHKGVREAKDILRTKGIDVVFSKGGYVSLPATLAARSLKIPVVTHESDATLGLANRIIARFAKAVITANPDIKYKDKCVNLGNPVRDSIMQGNKANILPSIRYDDNKPFLLVVGGSSGARALNSFVFSNIDALTDRYNVLHITGIGNNNLTHKGYTGVEFADNIEDYLDLADRVISRSGANAVTELLALEKRTLFVPLTSKASRGDQLLNARAVEADGLATVLLEDELNVENVWTKLEDTPLRLGKVHYYDTKTPDKIADLVISIGKMAKNNRQ